MLNFFLFNTILFRCKMHIFSLYRYIFHATKNWENSPKVDSEKREEGQEDKLSGQVDWTEVLFMHHVEYSMRTVSGRLLAKIYLHMKKWSIKHLKCVTVSSQYWHYYLYRLLAFRIFLWKLNIEISITQTCSTYSA